jgi:transcriptional regulator with XRE-family HTH domain
LVAFLTLGYLILLPKIYLAMDNTSIKTHIHNLRKKKNLTQNEIANLLNISTNAYRKIEKGSTAIINAHVIKLADLMETTTEELVLGYSPTQTMDSTIKEVHEEYGNKVNLLENRVTQLEKLIDSLEETIATKNEIITMLKKMLAEQK